MTQVGRHVPPGILEIEPVRLHADAAGLCAALLTCEPALFDIGAFEREGIPYPDAIVRSVRKRQAEFFFGRMAARHAMAAAGFPHADVGVGPSREPLWPAGLVGSITHSGAYAAAAVARRSEFGGIGIDVERVASADSLSALQALVVDARERALLGRVETTWTMALLTTLVFSAKESLYKAAFASVGRFFDFSAARVDDVQVAAGTLTLVLVESLSEEFPVGRACSVRFRLLRPDVVFTSFTW